MNPVEVTGVLLAWVCTCIALAFTAARAEQQGRRTAAVVRFVLCVLLALAGLVVATTGGGS